MTRSLSCSQRAIVDSSSSISLLINWVADGPGFTDEFFATMKENYRANLDVEDSGAVVAAPDGDTPGGSYYYHWMRDAGLSIKAWMDINDNDYNTVKDVLEGYVGKCHYQDFSRGFR